MMTYLTGASSSLANSSEVVQTDVNKSLGGYISSSVVPNGSVNSLFDMVSMLTLKNKPRETIGIGLVNKFDTAVTDVTIRIVTNDRNIGKFKIAAVEVGDDYCMEHIPNRYAEPIQAEFYDVDFYRPFVDVKIINNGDVGEVISFSPFNISVTLTDVSSTDSVMKDVIKAFNISGDYTAKKLSKDVFRITSNDDITLEEPIVCSYVSDGHAEFEFLGNYDNVKAESALIADTLESGKAIGLWLQREINPIPISNEQLLQNYDNKVIEEEVEDVELLITYNIN